MGFNQGLVAGFRAWYSVAMMARYKDVGLGGGQALWHCLKARGEVGRRETGQGKRGKETADLLRRHPPIGADPRRPDRGPLPGAVTGGRSLLLQVVARCVSIRV